MTFSTSFMRVQVVRCPLHIYVAVWFQRTNVDHLIIDYSHCWEAPGSAIVKRSSCGGSGTGTTLTGTGTTLTGTGTTLTGTSTTFIGTGTHMQWSNGTGTKYSGAGTPRLLEYHCTFGIGTTLTGTGTNMRSL